MQGPGAVHGRRMPFTEPPTKKNGGPLAGAKISAAKLLAGGVHSSRGATDDTDAAAGLEGSEILGMVYP